MLFNSLTFLVFLAVTLLIFHLARRWGGTAQAMVLLGASVIFYGWGDPAIVLLILVSILVNFAVSRILAERNATKTYVLGCVFNLGLLGVFKYTGFICENINALAGGSVLLVPEIALPLGISFFTFQQIEYLTEIRRGARAEPSLGRFALFVTYFPHLIAGPMVAYRDLAVQFDRLGRGVRPGNLACGLSLFAIGLFKKTVIADSLSLFVAPVFDAPVGAPAPDLIRAWGGALAYGLQIYFDFSAYSDMALGLGRMMGIRLPVNFFSPYKAASFIEFWRRWHITLSTFLARHIYQPLGGNRQGLAAQAANILVTMFLGGLWHGANWTFVVWGVGHGLFIALNHLWRRIHGPALPRSLAMPLTFLLVIMLWVPFRAANFGRATEILQGLIGLNGAALPQAVIERAGALGELAVSAGIGISPHSPLDLIFNALWVLAAASIAFFAPNASELFRRHLDLPPLTRMPGLLRWRPSPAWAMATALLGAAGLVRLSAPSEFLYFRF